MIVLLFDTYLASTYVKSITLMCFLRMGDFWQIDNQDYFIHGASKEGAKPKVRRLKK